MKIGTTDIAKMYLGSTEIPKAYLGSALAYEAGGGGGDTPQPDPPVVLPDGYKACKWIANPTEGTGAYIDTGIHCASGVRICGKVENGMAGSTNKFIFGATDASNAKMIQGGAPSNTTVHKFEFKNSTFSKGYYNAVATEHTFDLSKDRLIYDGTEYQSSPAPTATFTSDYPIYMCGRYFKYYSNTYCAVAKYYYFQIYENDVLVRDFVPAYEQSSGKYGMYDLENDTFYSSASSVEFQGEQY